MAILSVPTRLVRVSTHSPELLCYLASLDVAVNVIAKETKSTYNCSNTKSEDIKTVFLGRF